MSDFVTFDVNIPQELELAYDDGLLKETRFGDKVYYRLTDGRTLSVSPVVSDMIAEKGIVRHQPFLMCKTEVRKPGAKKATTEWRIVPKEPEAPPAARPPEMPPEPPGFPDPPPQRLAEVNTEQQLRASIKQLESRRAGASVVAPTPVRQIAEATHTHSNGNNNGHANGSASLRLPPTKIPMNIAVIEVVRMVQAAMKATGEQWSDQSRQDLTSTILIQAGREGWLCLWERGGE